MDAVTPLFIFGMGRSGTTNAQRAVNAHPLVAMNGEISLSVLKQFLTLLDAADRAHGDTREAWLERKADYMFESFGYLSKGGRGKLHRRADARYMGHKTPRLESLFDEYETHFASAGLRPRYFYCARNPFDCWRSYKAMDWNRYEEVKGFLVHYVKSFQKLDEITARVPGRVGLLNLDEMIAMGDAAAYYREKLFEPLGLDMPERVIQRIEKLSADRSSAPRPTALSAEDRRAIETYPGIAELHKKMFAAFKR